MTERQPYRVLERLPNFEVRLYPRHVLVEVVTKGSFVQAGNTAFQPLVSYISGRNVDRQKFAMTAPVLQAPDASETVHKVSFVLPANTSPDAIPKPSDGFVTTRVVEEKRVAALGFGGSWNEARFKEQGRTLLESVKAAGLKTAGDVYFARFDPPWKPGFLKHNEALIDLE
ncbi:MAG: SOUL family heme-binding protein [Microbacteriaceae bacterium]